MSPQEAKDLFIYGLQCISCMRLGFVLRKQKHGLESCFFQISLYDLSGLDSLLCKVGWTASGRAVSVQWELVSD